MGAGTSSFESPWGRGRPLDGMTALVTGAGRGIGRGVAEELVAAGAHVVAADIDLAAAQETSERLGDSSEAADVDVRDPASVERLLRSVTGTGRRIDILANVAGVLTISPVIDLPVQDWDRVMGVNARGVFLMCRAALPGMIDSGGGAIINISSAAGKDGVAMAAHSLAKEVAEFGIRVNAVCPGVVRTPMIDDVATAWKTSVDAMVTQWQLIKRTQDAREIGAAVVFLALMPSMTGQSINVDGGSVFH
jgi:meso-butanediol dehydrogenase / (S,S)-butanediol dehydrogenase / diacetyl reductase